MKPTPERYTEIDSVLSRSETYFSRLSHELDPTGRDHQATVIMALLRNIAELRHDLKQQQLPPAERGKSHAAGG